MLQGFGNFVSNSTDQLSMQEAACWADDLKDAGQTSMASWHFWDQPYFPTSFRKVLPPDDVTVSKEIDNMRKGLLSKTSVEWTQTFSLANLIHFYADVHQPLHVTALFSEEYPNGDRGGNAIVPVGVNGSYI